jgi:hypothetical protein
MYTTVKTGIQIFKSKLPYYKEHKSDPKSGSLIGVPYQGLKLGSHITPQIGVQNGGPKWGVPNPGHTWPQGVERVFDTPPPLKKNICNKYYY